MTLTSPLPGHAPAPPPQQSAGDGPGDTLWLPAALDCDLVADLAARPRPDLELDPAADALLDAGRAGLEALLQHGVPVYGATTGFGPHVAYPADEDPYRQGSGLIAHLASGAGGWAGPDVVRATMVVRAAALAQGRSAVRPATVRALLSLLRSGIVPAVPELGSVGASGDLIPLAHIARVLTGEGLALADTPGAHLLDRTRPAREALAAAGLEPVALDARDALSLVNGTSWSTALSALAVVSAERLVERTQDLVGWLYAGLGARRQALDPRLHSARHQAGQIQAAAGIRAQLEASLGAGRSHGVQENAERALQEVYSLRCSPQVLGPARHLVATARGLVDDELLGVSDNPIVVEDPHHATGWTALHGGNFHAAAVATASDLVNGALTQVAVLAERLVDVLANPATSRGPLLLATRPGAQAGIAGAQLTASAVLAEMRHACSWASTSSIPTNAGNQDVVPMAPLAARTALAQTRRLATVLGVLAVAVGQQQHLVRRGLADGTPVAPPAWLPGPAGFDEDVETRSLVAEAARCALGEPARRPAQEASR